MAHDTHPSLQLTLTVAEINQVLEALGRRPYARVFQLIGRIQQQAASQFAPAETAAPAGPAHP